MSVAINLFIIVVIIINVLLHYKNGDATQGQIRGYVVPKAKQKNVVEWYLVKGQGPNTNSLKSWKNYQLVLVFNLDSHE